MNTENNADAKTLILSAALTEEYESSYMQQIMSANVSDDDKLLNDVPVKFVLYALRNILFNFLRQEWGMQGLRTGMENYLAASAFDASGDSGTKNESLNVAVGLQYSSTRSDPVRMDQLVPRLHPNSHRSHVVSYPERVPRLHPTAHHQCRRVPGGAREALGWVDGHLGEGVQVEEPDCPCRVHTESTKSPHKARTEFHAESTQCRLRKELWPASQCFIRIRALVRRIASIWMI